VVRLVAIFKNGGYVIYV